ncbi:MAG: hypothetical protein GY719_04445 [bacterium]|nr:hypothetical protein [bacterium]
MSQAAKSFSASSRRRRSRPRRRSRTNRGEQRHKRLLTRAKKDPRTVLKDRRCLKPAFCRAFLDHCHDMALRDEERALELAPIAAELAAKTGDPHLVHFAEGVRVHTHIANEQHEKAREVLADYRLSALACCSSCAADWHLRQGDLLLEDREFECSGEAMERSLESLGVQSGDAYGRLCVVRGVDYHFKGDRERALEDMATALLEIALSSPQGYFLDALALLLCFIQANHVLRHDERVREILDLFRARLLGVDGMTAVRVRLSWVEGQISARLGDLRRAHDDLARTRKHLLASGPRKHLLAVGLDHCQLWSWRSNEESRREILRMLGHYETVLDLEPALAERLHETIEVVRQRPRKTAGALARLRRSFIVPVPGIVRQVWWMKKNPRRLSKQEAIEYREKLGAFRNDVIAERLRLLYPQR